MDVRVRERLTQREGKNVNKQLHHLKQSIGKHDRKIRLTSHFVMAFALFVVFSTLFIKLAKDVRELETASFDKAVLTAINGWSTSLLDTVIPVVTNFGGAFIVIALTFVLAGLFVYKREYYRAMVVLVGVGGASVLNLILKAIFERPRPTLWERIVVEHGFSFPSGHAMASAALGVALAVALWNSRWRWWAFTTAAAYIVIIGFTRLYLGVHYPTDIVAGWFVSIAWVMAVALLFNTRLARSVLERRKKR